MVNNNKMDGIDVLCKFYQLSEEEQKNVLKRLLVTTVRNGLKEEEQTVSMFADIDKATTSLLDLVYSEDEELKNSVFKHFVQNYENIVQQKREEMCNFCHDFTEWDRQLVERAHYDIDKEDETCYIPRYVRVCKKCGFKQVAYTKTGRKHQESYIMCKEEIIGVKKLINKPNTEN